MSKVINKATWHITSFAPYYINVHILTSVDGGKTFYYAGNGRFCETIEEANAFCKSFNVVSCEKENR